MRLSALSIGLSVLVCQSNWLAAFAQGDPVITPSGPQPKFEVIDTPNNNNNQIFLQNLQNFQNQQNAFFNNPALNLNPSITGLDQRSGLIQNSTNVNMFGVNGLAINSYNVPKINNSNLMAISDVVGWSKDLANFLIKTDPKMNIDRDLIPKLNNTSTPHLISALVMALGLPQDLLIDLVGRATSGALDSVRNSLIQLAAAIKTGKITPADAQKALLQIVSGAQQMKSSMVYTPPASTTSTTTTVVKQISSIVGPTTVVANTGVVTPTTTVTNINPTSIKSSVPQVTIVSATAQAVPNVTVSSIKTTTTPILNSTTNSNSPITSVTSISSIPISELSKNLLEGKDKIDTKLIETAIQVQNTTSSTASVAVSKSEKESSLGDKMNKLDSALDKIQNATQNKTTTAITTVGNTATTIGTVVNDPVKLATNNANAVVSTVSNVVSSITNALSIPISNSSAKAVTTNTNYIAPPVIPNPVVLATATIINLQVTRLNLPPIIAAAVMTKAALGHFNNMPGAVTSLAQVLMTPGVTPKEAQALLIGFLEATGKPNDIPVATIVAAMPATASTASTPAPTKDQVVQKLTAITNFVKEMATGLSKSNNTAINTNSMAKMVTAINETMTSTTNQMQGMISGSGTTMDSLMNAMQNTMNTMQTIQTGMKH